MRDDEEREHMQDAGQDTGGDYRPNEAFQAVLEAKANLDRKTWPGR